MQLAHHFIKKVLQSKARGFRYKGEWECQEFKRKLHSTTVKRFCIKALRVSMYPLVTTPYSHKVILSIPTLASAILTTIFPAKVGMKINFADFH